MDGKVLVTGASGLVGANMVRALLGKGRNVHAMVHTDKRALDGLNVKLVQADVRDPLKMEQIVQDVETVYHLAGSISLEMDSGVDMEAVNVQGTRNVVDACLKHGVRRLVHFSSVDALSHEPIREPVDETRPLLTADQTKVSPYDLSKAEAERAVLAGIQKGLHAIIIRPTAMLGPHDFKPSYLGQALIRLANGKIPALVSSGFDWVDVRDVVEGAIQAEVNAPSGSCYMLSGNWHTLREVADMVAAFTNTSAPMVSVPMWLADAFAPAMLKLANFNGAQPIYTRVTLNALRGDRRVSSTRAKRELGYRVRPLQVTIQDTLAWFKEQDYLEEIHA